MQDAKALLQLLTERIAPGENQRHSLTLADDGEKLQVTLMLGDRYVPFVIEEDDLLKPVNELVDEILSIVGLTSDDFCEHGNAMGCPICYP